MVRKETLPTQLPGKMFEQTLSPDFSDGQNKFRYRMEMEHCVKGDGNESRNFLHRIKRTVNEGWPDDMEGIAAADHGAKRTAQGQQRRQRYIDSSLK